MVVHFADRAYLDVPFTPVSSVDWSKVRFMESRGGTALYDAVVAAEDFVEAKAHQKRRAIVIISDGEDNASSLNLEQAARRISELSAPLIYGLRFSEEHDFPAEVEHAEKALKTLTRASGGVMLIAGNAKDMARRVEEISDMIGGQMTISFASANVASPGRFHKLDVRVAERDKREEVHAMPGYYEGRPGSGKSAN
jgi:VWFA-related protein